jgi:Kef-type K+ transport system membrane component KefB
VPDIAFLNLLGVLLIALLAPLGAALLPALRVPAVVLEIVFGIVVGPHGLRWLEPDLAVQVVALLGLAMLLFLAGLEVDVRAWRGSLVGLILLGYACSLGIGYVAGWALGPLGWVSDPGLLAVTLSATSLGLVVAVLKDGGLLATPLARTTIAAASLADFAAVLLLSILFSTDGRSAASKLELLALFAALVTLVVLAAALSGRNMRLSAAVVKLQDGTAAIRVRAAVLLMVAFVVLAQRVGLESILGAFLAGAAVAALDRGSTSHPHFRLKLESLGYGFLIPVFFISSGMRLDVLGLFAAPRDALRVPLFAVALLAARALPAVFFRRRLGWARTGALGLLLATSLPFIVTATQIGMLTGRIAEATGTALVCAGLVSVLVFPAVAVSLARRSEQDQPEPEPALRDG